MLRQVVVGWEVLLIEVQAVALGLEAKLLVLEGSCCSHWSLRGVRMCSTVRGFHLDSPEGGWGGGGGGGVGTSGAVGIGRRAAAIGPHGLGWVLVPRGGLGTRIVSGTNMERDMCLARPHPSLLRTARTLLLGGVTFYTSKLLLSVFCFFVTNSFIAEPLRLATWLVSHL